MKVSQKIGKQLQEIPVGTTFKYEDLPIESSEYQAAAKVIGRFIHAGTLKRISKGVFYKPKETLFGALPPREDEVLKQFLFKNGERVAYVTGTSLYNKIGLTTQMSFVVIIASKSRRGTVLTIGNIKIKPVKSYARVTDENYYLLGLLDAIKDFNQIPDMDAKSVISLLVNKLKKLTPQQITNLIQNALFYPPRTRALVGAILETMDNSLDLTLLKKSLNPLSKYKLGMVNNFLPTATHWNFK